MNVECVYAYMYMYVDCVCLTCVLYIVVPSKQLSSTA